MAQQVQQIKRRKYIIDTDVGVDDAIAIVVALRDPNIDVIGFTCVQGNVSVDQACTNVGHLIKLVNKPTIPIFRGTAKPLIGAYRNATWPGHGDDGLGNTKLGNSGIPVQSEHAANALYRIARECKEKGDDLHLVFLGPLTNLALTVTLYPDFPSLLAPGNILIMGGAYTSRGNATFSAEFNIYDDPEAAAICFENYPKLVMSSWELCMDFPLGNKFLKEVFDSEDSLKNPIRKFLRDIFVHYRTISLRPFGPADLMAISVALCPKIITEFKELHGVVELGGTYSRGATLFDWSVTSTKPKNIRVITAVNTEEYYKFVESLL